MKSQLNGVSLTGLAVMLCCLAVLPPVLAEAAEEVKFRTAEEAVLNVYWTDTPPVMDGKMDDACWQEAEVAKDFFLFKHAGVPLNQTEVRVSYDAENLYVFWKLYEKDIDQLKEGTPDQTRDHISWVDCVELFLDPGRTEKRYYQLASNPSSQLYDGVYGFPNATIEGFSPDWEPVSGRFEGGWTMEQKIPFGELALGGMMVATPQVGDHWGLTFCRNQGPLHEWSQWVPTDRGFHEPVNNGHAYFRGRKAGEALPAVPQAKPGSLFYGPSALEFTVENARDLKVAATVQRGEAAPAELPARIEGEVVTIPYQLLEGGVTRFAFQLASAGKLFYTGQAVADQPLIRAPLAAMAQAAKGDQEMLAQLGTPHPRIRMVAWQLNGFLQKVQEAQAQLDQGAALTAPQWQALIDDTQVLQDDWHKLQFDLALAKAYPGKPGEPQVAFAVGSGTENDKFYKDLAFTGSTTEPIRLALAGNEYGSYQLVIMPFWRNLSEVTVNCSELKGPGGKTIPAEASRWFRVGYVKLENWNPRTSLGREYEPDPLLPAAPFSVARDEQAAVWVDMKLPAGAPAGVYRGKVTVSAEGQEVERVVEVRSYGFDIPVHTSFEADVWHSVYNWNRFYGNTLKYNSEINAKHSEVLGRYRVNSIPGDWITICPQVPIYREADGHFPFDFSTFDEYVKNGVANGSRSFWCALSCNSGWTAWLNDPNRQ
ncbi:MAG: hypothetical protein GX100_12835, partial [candidate division WS1 bacterium]|nr:hypothetical protein [candidate division WS1 bacterium]